MPNDRDFESLGDVLRLADWVGEEGINPVPVDEILKPTEVPEGDDSPLDMLVGLDGVKVEEAPDPSSEDELGDMDFSPGPAAPAGGGGFGGGAGDGDDEDDALSFMADMGLKQQRETPDIRKPWMRYHEFVLIKSVEQLNEVVDAAIAAGKCALDTETQGLDTRVYWRKPEDIKEVFEEWWDGPRPERIPQTVHKIVGYCLSYDGKTGYYVPIRHTAENSQNVDIVAVGKVIQRLCRAAQPVLTDEGYAQDPLSSPLIKEMGKVKIYFWNGKFDQEMMFPVTGIDWWHPESFEDGLLLYYCKYTNDKNLDLKSKSKNQLSVQGPNGPIKDEKGMSVPYEMIELKELFVSASGRRREIAFATLHPEEGLRYGCSDAICTFLHCDNPVLAGMVREPLYANTYRLEKQTAQALRGMERNRVFLDLPYVRTLFETAKKEAEEYRVQIVALAAQHGFNNFDPQSPQQLSEFLFSSPNGLNITPKPEINEKSGWYKTDADTLEGIVEGDANANPVLLTIVKYRQVEKVIGTYLESMTKNCDSNDEARLQFKQHGAATGRISAPAGKPDHGFCGFPPHGIPGTYDEKKPKVATALRQAFKARAGFTMAKVDFAGEELRIVTNLSGEPVWIKEFKEGTGDLHSITARAFFSKQEITKQERQQGKIANFSLVYGGGAQAIMRATGCSQQEGARRKANFDKAMPVFTTWVRGQKAFVKAKKGIRTPFGRWVYIPEIDSVLPDGNPNKPLIAAAERWSINYPIQGAGADIMKMALVLLHKEFYKLGWLQKDLIRMLMTVHDEIVFEIRHEGVEPGFFQKAMHVIEVLMTLPGRLVKWEIPLEVEPLIDTTWDCKIDYHKVMKGEHKPEKEGDKPLKSNQVRFGDRVYAKVPEWLEGVIFPNYMPQPEGLAEWLKQSFPTGGSAKPPASPTPQVSAPVPSTPTVTAPAAPVPQAAPVSQAVQAPVQAPTPKLNGTNGVTGKNSKSEVFTYQLGTTTRQSVHQVAAAVVQLLNIGDCKVLHLVCGKTNETLIEPTLGFHVNPDEFARRMRDHNL